MTTTPDPCHPLTHELRRRAQEVAAQVVAETLNRPPWWRRAETWMSLTAIALSVAILVYLAVTHFSVAVSSISCTTHDPADRLSVGYTNGTTDNVACSRARALGRRVPPHRR